MPVVQGSGYSGEPASEALLQAELAMRSSAEAHGRAGRPGVCARSSAQSSSAAAVSMPVPPPKVSSRSPDAQPGRRWLW